VSTPINLREPGSVLRFAEHMFRDYSKNALAVREQREDNVYRYLKGELPTFDDPFTEWKSQDEEERQEEEEEEEDNNNNNNNNEEEEENEKDDEESE
jgi:hypothetical protein